MRSAWVVMCLLTAGIISRPWNPTQLKENQKMEHQKSAVRFVESEALPPRLVIRRPWRCVPAG